MDFLDPKAKRRHTIRLFIGYGLMATVILLTSAILVFSAYGFDLDRKTGEVIQNGLVFVDSNPDTATVLFNDQPQRDRTNNRFSLPSGQYNLKIQKEGYRQWERNFGLGGGEVERFVYPLLIPNTLERRAVQVYGAAPTYVTGSPDRRWVIANQAGSLTDFIEYDLNTLVKPAGNPQARQFSVPANIFSPGEGEHALQLVEWSTDNKNMLVKHTFAGKSEFIIISRDQPESSININLLLALNPTNVTLRDKKFDQWYIYTEQGGILQSANTNKVIAPVATGVTAYKTHDDNTILYASLLADGKKQRVTIKQGNSSYIVRDLMPGKLFLDTARYDGKWQVVIGSDAEHKTYIYTDPVQVTQKKDGTTLLPSSILKATGPMTAVSFSQNVRFVVTQSGQHFEVYDGEYAQVYKYNIPGLFDVGTPVVWMDGHRLAGSVNGKALIFDFDGSNRQELVASLPKLPLIFDRDYSVLYSVDKAATAGSFSFYATDLRIAADK